MANRKKSYPIIELTQINSTSPGEPLPQCDNVQDSNYPGENKPPAKNHPFQAFIFVLLCCIFLTLLYVLVKKITYINPGQLTLVRNAGMFAGSLPIAVYKTKDVIGKKQDRSLLLLRGFLGGIALYLNHTAYRFLPLAEASILMSITPAVTSVMAFFYSKEPFGLMQGISLIFTIVGVLLSVRLPELLSNRTSTHFDFTYAMGLASGVGFIVLISMCIVILRKLKHVHFSTNLLYFGFVGMVVNASINAVTTTYESARCGWDQVLVMLILVFGFLGNLTFTLSIQKEDARIVAILKTSLDIIVAMVFQIIFFGEKLNTYNISGACLVIVSVSLQGVRNWLQKLPEESRIKKKLKLFLV